LAVIKIVIRILINAVALWVASWVVNAVAPEGLIIPTDFGGLLLVAIVFGLVNAFIKPIVQILSCPLTMLTLGLFTVVINALMLMLTGWLTGGGIITSFWPAVLGSVIISIVSMILSSLLTDKG
jgi:putative membrane protein